MSAGDARVVLEVLRGPKDGARQTIENDRLSVGAAEGDDLTLPGDEGVADANMKLAVAAGGTLEVTADKPFRINSDEIQDRGQAKAGDVIGIGATEFVVVEVAKGEGGGGAQSGAEVGDARPGVKKCPKCGADNDPNAPWCGNCGRDL